MGVKDEERIVASELFMVGLDSYIYHSNSGIAACVDKNLA